MGNLISRQAVIEIVENNHAHDITLCGDAYSEGYRDGIRIKQSDILEDLAKLPLTEQRVTRYWVPVSVAEYIGVEGAMCKYEISHHICSECLEMALEKDGDEVLSDFCPHCGAKMEG